MNNEFSYKNHKVVLLLAIIPISVVVFNTSRFLDLYDFSYILDNAYLISIGKIPYRDFILHTTPGTYLIQAFIIKFVGFTVYSQIIYCSIISALTFLITYRILFFFNTDKLLNIAIALPVTVTGGYGILSIPFYEPDCIFFVLLSIFITFLCYSRSFPFKLAFFAGILLFLPFLFKQNIGLAYLFALHFVLIVTLFHKNERLNFKKYLYFLLGSVTAFTLLLTYLLITSSYNEFYNCIFNLNFNHYLKTRTDRIASDFLQNFSIKILIYTFIILCIIPVIKYLKIKRNWQYLLVIILAATPLYLIPWFKLIIRNLNYYLEFLVFIPVILNIGIIAFIYSFYKLKEIPVFLRYVSLVIIGVIYAAFTSQGYWGSHYGIWPMLSILFSGLFLILSRSLFSKHVRLLRGLLITNSILITVSISFYIFENQRFSEFQIFDFKDKIYHSETSNLKGISYPGELVPNMDNFFNYIQEEIPANDAVIILPHEDPFYTATHRYPYFPVFINDVTLGILTIEEIIEKVNISNVKWMIIKTRNTQGVFGIDYTNSWKHIMPLVKQLKETFMLYKTLPGYEVYKIADQKR